MDLTTMRTEARYIIGQTDTTNSDFTQAQLTAWANEFYRLVCVNLEVLPIKERAYTTATTLTLNSGTETINRAKFLIQPDGIWIELEIRDMDDLISMYPDYENATNDKPRWLVRTGTFTARLFPPLNTANDAQASGLKTYGLEMPTDLSSDSDTPDLPANLHDLFPHYMAHKAFIRLGMSDRGKDELIMANAGIKAQRNISTKFSNKKGWAWMQGDPGATSWGS